MINIPHKLKEKIQDRILVRQTDNYAEFFSPVHSLYIRLNENCMLSSEGIETDIESFTDQETPLHNESFRMYQQAFLKPPPVFTRMNLELTRSCSLHCPHCFIENSDCPEKSLFDIELISRLIKYSPSEISLTGGEIFLMENLEDIIRKTVSLSQKKILFRLLANGSWMHNKSRVNKFIGFINETDTAFQFRFTLFHYRQEIHDLICGSAGMFRALFDLLKKLEDSEIPFSVNIPLTAYNFDERFDAVEFMDEKTSGNYTVSSIIYPSLHALRHARRISLSEGQFTTLLDENEFRPLASAYCDPAPQCMYHCRFPLLDATGKVYACNLPGSREIDYTEDSFVPGKYSLSDKCSSCMANEWCKKCPSAISEYSDLYCPLARIAAEKVNNDYMEAVDQGFSQIHHF